MMLPVTFDWIIDDELLANAFCSSDIIARPGIRNAVYDTPGYTSTRPASTCENTSRYSNAVMIGAATVWKLTFQNRSISL